MKFAGTPVAFIVILFLAAFLFLKYSLSSSPLLLFSLLNTIIMAIVVGSFRPSTCEVDEVFPFFGSSDALGVYTHDDIGEYSDDKDDDYDDEYYGSDGYEEDEDANGSDSEHYGSDGYEEDEDDSGSYDEIGWEDEEECDDNLQKRAEDFIAKAHIRWKEENLRDQLSSS